MPEQSLISLIGIPSTKELPATGILKTGNSSLQSNQSNHGENSFLAKLAYSMNSESTIDDQDSTLGPFEQNNISNIEGINHLTDMVSMSTPTNIATNIHGDQMPLYQVLNHDIPVEAFTNGTINNNINNGKASSVQTQANTFPSHALPDNQGSSTFNEPDINLTRIAQETARDPHPGLSSTSFTDKLNTSQISTKTDEQNVTGTLNKLNPAKIADKTVEEPLSQSSTIQGKQIAESHKGFNTNQNDTKINEQNATGTLNKLNPPKIADTTGEEPLSQSSTSPGKQIAEPYKGSSTNSLDLQLDTNKNSSQGQTPASSVNNFNTNLNNQNNARINNKNTASNSNKLDNAPTIEETSSVLTFQASRTSSSRTNSLPQYNSKLAQTDSSESQKILDTHQDSTGAIVSKSPDNTTSINNYGVNSVNADETVLQVNTSPENSSFNNQGTDTLDEFYINAVKTKQKAEPARNFTSTLSQINNSAKPFVSLGSNTADNIVQNARLFMEGGKSEIRLQLNPPELGTLKLEFAVEDNNLEAKITVERSAVKDVIEKDIPRLRELISNADIDVGKLDVSLQEKEDEKLSLMDKDLQSGSESDSTKDLPDQDNEFLEDGIDEESIEYDEDSNKINFLV